MAEDTVRRLRRWREMAQAERVLMFDTEPPRDRLAELGIGRRPLLEQLPAHHYLILPRREAGHG